MKQLEQGLREWSEQIGVPFGTFKDWGYRLLKKKGVAIKSPVGLVVARKIAVVGQEASSRAKGGTKKAALANYQRCSDFLERTRKDVQQ